MPFCKGIISIQNQHIVTTVHLWDLIRLPIQPFDFLQGNGSDCRRRRCQRYRAIRIVSKYRLTSSRSDQPWQFDEHRIRTSPGGTVATTRRLHETKMWFHTRSSLQHSSPCLRPLPHPHCQHSCLRISDPRSSLSPTTNTSSLPILFEAFWHRRFDSDSICTSFAYSIRIDDRSMPTFVLEHGISGYAWADSNDLGFRRDER